MKLSSLMLPLVGVTALFAVACTDGDTIVQPAGQGQTGISVSGTGIAIGEPDVAIITVGVNVERDSVEQAREDAANAQQAIIDSLKANGCRRCRYPNRPLLGAAALQLQPRR